MQDVWSFARHGHDVGWWEILQLISHTNVGEELETLHDLLFRYKPFNVLLHSLLKLEIMSLLFWS